MRSRSARHLLTLSALTLASPACDGSRPGAPDAQVAGQESAPIRTDRESYAVSRGPDGEVRVTIGLRYENATGGPTYMPTCHGVYPPVLEKRVGSAWVTAYSPVVLHCLGPPVVVQPGESYSHSYQVLAFPRGGNSHPTFEADEVPGTYRLAWIIYDRWMPNGPEPGLGRLLPLAARVSNAFELTE